MRLINEKGTVWYGLHMYPGVAEYREAGREPYRVFINEDTIRKMDPTFAGRPVFVKHVDEVDEDVNELRKTADGWVLESFFNAADGKHWVKFIIVSDDGEKAIKNRWKLSNCYLPKSLKGGGQWNGVSYAKEVADAEYEHLAIVPNPRYEESIILTPEQFKAYNEEKELELKRLANDDKESTMGLKFFKRAKVENAADLEDTVVLLPKSKREIVISQLVSEMDEIELAKKEPRLANAKDLVKVGEKEQLTVEELLAKVKSLQNEVESLKANADDEDEELENEDDESCENEDDEKAKAKDEDDEDPKKAKNKKKNKKKNADDDEDDEDSIEALEKRLLAKKKANALRDAPKKARYENDMEEFSPASSLERGKARYGSGK